jgi:hypothetical protein
MKRWPVVCVFAWAVAAAVASDAPLSELAPPGTKVAVGINVRGVLDSPAVKELRKAFAAQEKDLVSGMGSNLHLPGFDPLKDVDQIWILATTVADKAPLLVIVRGRFDAEQLASGAKRYKGIPVIEGGVGTGAAIGLLGSETAIAGETAQVQAAIDRLGSGAQLEAELKTRMDAAAASYDIWGIGDVPDGMPIPTTGTPPGSISIDRFMFGLAMRQGETLTAEIHARSTEDAAKMMAYLSMIQAAWKEQNKDSASTLDVQSDNGTFRISMTVPDEEVRKGIDKMRSFAAMAEAGKPGAEAAPPPAPVPAAAPETAPAPAPAAAPAALPAPETAPAPAAESPAPPPPTLVSPGPAVVAAPPMAPKPANQPRIVKAPNGDTMIVKLPGGK